MSAKKTVEDAVASHKIVIFSKSYCPYCKQAKNLFNSDFAHLKDQIFITECVPPPSDFSHS
jgi:glutaredoxin 3